METITLTRFEKSTRAFTVIDSYKACLCNEHDNCHPIGTYMDGLIRQLRNHADEPHVPKRSYASRIWASLAYASPGIVSSAINSASGDWRT